MVPKPNCLIHIVLSTMIEEVSMYHSWLNLFQAKLVLNPFPNKKLCGETHMCTVWHQISEYNNGPWMFVHSIHYFKIIIFISISFIFFYCILHIIIHILGSPDVKHISIIFTRRMPWQKGEITCMGRTFIDIFDIGFQCVPILKYLSHLFHKIDGNKKTGSFFEGFGKRIPFSRKISWNHWNHLFLDLEMLYRICILGKLDIQKLHPSSLLPVAHLTFKRLLLQCPSTGAKPPPLLGADRMFKSTRSLWRHKGGICALQRTHKPIHGGQECVNNSHSLGVSPAHYQWKVKVYRGPFIKMNWLLFHS